MSLNDITKKILEENGELLSHWWHEGGHGILGVLISKLNEELGTVKTGQYLTALSVMMESVNMHKLKDMSQSFATDEVERMIIKEETSDN